MKLVYSILTLSLLCAPKSEAFWWSWSDAPAQEVQEKRSRPRFHLEDVLTLEDRLNARVVDQKEAIQTISDTLISYKAGIYDKNKPIGCFLFVGASGVGKTELAKALTAEIAEKPISQFIRLNMSEFQGRGADLHRLIGIPPGYMDSEKGGELSNAIRNNPYSVVLLDEFEKASSEVRLLFLHIFDEGYFTSSRHEHIDCRNCIFIATTNLAAELIEHELKRSQDLDKVFQAIEGVLTYELTPELCGRVTPVLFRPISPTALRKIVEMRLKELASTVYNQHQVKLVFEDSLINYICKKSSHGSSGARAVQSCIKKDVLGMIARSFVTYKHKQNDIFVITAQEGAVQMVLYQD